MALNPFNLARKGALAYIGALLMTRDELSRTIDTFARRGAQVERAARERLGQTARSLRSEVRDEIAAGQEQVEQAGSALVSGRDRLLDALNIPTYADVLKLNAELDRLAGGISDLRVKQRELARAAAEAAAVSPNEPLPGYEKLGAEAVIDRLPELEEPALLAVRAYEQERGRRITVLRAVERALLARQAARGALDEPPTRTTIDPLPRYEELRADEVIERIAGLSDAELLHVKVYEQEHQNRVTVLRAIDERLRPAVEAEEAESAEHSA